MSNQQPQIIRITDPVPGPPKIGAARAMAVWQHNGKAFADLHATGAFFQDAIAHRELQFEFEAYQPKQERPNGPCWFRAVERFQNKEIVGLFIPYVHELGDWIYQTGVIRWMEDHLTNIRYGKPLSEEPDV